ncbi:hypothetical protein WA171_006873 [Blastocystis sp. BT1]
MTPSSEKDNQILPKQQDVIPPAYTAVDSLPPVVHLREKHICTICNKEFSQKSSLNRHLKLHKGIKPYSCSFKCGKVFSTLSNCKRHELQHSNQTPFVCPVPGCLRSFKSASALDYHKKTHTGIKSFVCPVEGCQRSYWFLEFLI